MIQGTKIYKVEITAPAASDEVEKGFIDPKKPYDYGEDFEFKADDASLKDYQNKARGYVRYQQMCMNLQKGLDTLTELEIEGDTVKTAPTKLTFKLVYTQPDALVVELTKEEYDAETVAEDKFETRDGRMFIKGASAIKYLIGDVLLKRNEAHTVIGNYFNSESRIDNQPKGSTFENLEINGPCASMTDAEGCVNVTELMEAKTEFYNKAN